jgi:hypothetical protein
MIRTLAALLKNRREIFVILLHRIDCAEKCRSISFFGNQSIQTDIPYEFSEVIISEHRIRTDQGTSKDIDQILSFSPSVSTTAKAFADAIADYTRQDRSSEIVALKIFDKFREAGAAVELDRSFVDNRTTGLRNSRWVRHVELSDHLFCEVFICGDDDFLDRTVRSFLVW